MAFSSSPEIPLASSPRKIIHMDMDAFFAAIEQRDHPELRGKPVIVGGDPKGRGVVATCSYEARKFGIHSAMAASLALKKCPQAIFIRPRMAVYAAVSRQIFALCQEFSSCIEPLSLDEAFLDVSDDIKKTGSATQTARLLLQTLYQETGLTASAGVSYNKFLAKVASDMRKPFGITVIRPEDARGFLDKLPVRKFYGVGKITEKKMHLHGIFTGGDLIKRGRENLMALFGKAGAEFHAYAMGLDERAVVPHRERKSMGREVTLAQDIRDQNAIWRILEALALDVEKSLLRKNVSGYSLTLKVKYQDFRCVTRTRTLPFPICRAEDMLREIPELLARTDAGRQAVRLLGISISHFPETMGERQMRLPFREPDKTGLPSFS
ncbi:DNA polymerase IV [Desulfobotulus sp.]|jgi:DNA polymerase-4|uniref:DNA polymerase IV n=1 Tax=Desulfobotulus sp. TaxID=1940337 RepID=UPI002A35D02B|nr:DNA polymerase IV [Desulfobotulus sp.]MDY0162361.1 DNA polymerase IV [Desulfobotulus sp.]